jgi:hypothetical protein
LKGDLKADVYELKAQLYAIPRKIEDRYIDSFNVDLSLPSLGNSATDPDYDLFTDRDYGLL